MSIKDESFLKRVAVTGVILPFFIIVFAMFAVSCFKDSEHAVLLGSELGKYYFYYLIALVFILTLCNLIDGLKSTKQEDNLVGSKNHLGAKTANDPNTENIESE